MPGPNGPYLGVMLMGVDDGLVKTLKLNEPRGAVITLLTPGGPAEKAGLKVKDVILEYDGQRVQGQEELRRMILESVPGHAVKIGVWRNGAMQTVEVTIEMHRENAVSVVVPRGPWGDAPDSWPSGVPMPPFSMDFPVIQTVVQNSLLGIECESLGDEQQFAEYFGVKDGLLVKMVTVGSPAARAGMKAGDVIVKVDETRVGTMRELNTALRASRPKGAYQVSVVRNKKDIQLTVQPQ
jgi:serine protease Do